MLQEIHILVENANLLLEILIELHFVLDHFLLHHWKSQERSTVLKGILLCLLLLFLQD